MLHYKIENLERHFDVRLARGGVLCSPTSDQSLVYFLFFRTRIIFQKKNVTSIKRNDE